MTAVEFKPRDCYNRHGAPKVAFAVKREAKQAARNSRHGSPHIYRCPYCRAWHIGNPTDDGRHV